MSIFSNSKALYINIIASTSHIVSEEDQILHVLAGLSPEYDSFIISIITRTEPSKFEDIVALLMIHETKLEQYFHNSFEINSLDINTLMSNPNIIMRFRLGRRYFPNAMLCGIPQHTQFSYNARGR